nr:MAG TPA: Primosomal protein 1 [Caudoviricetes sp.]
MVNSIWIELHQEMPRHPKTLALAQALKISRREAVGLLIDLWTWGLNCADETGHLRGITNEGIAMALDWSGRQAAKLVNALVDCGWIDGENGNYSLHDWADYTSRLSDKRKDAERKREARKRAKQADESPENPQNVPGQSADSPRKNTVNPRAGITKPNQTKPYITTSNNNPASIPVEEDVSVDTAALRKVCEEFSQAIHKPNEKEREQLRLLLGEYSMSTLLAAIQDASGKGRSVNYLRAILESWKRTGSAPTTPTNAPEPSFDLEEYERTSGWSCTEGGSSP